MPLSALAATLAAWAVGRVVMTLLNHCDVTRAQAARGPSRLPLRFGRARLQSRLNRAGVGMTPAQFALASVSLMLGAGGSVGTVTSSPGLAIVTGLVVGGGPVVWHDRRSRALARSRLEAWPDGLRDLATNLRAPMSLHDALVELATSGPVLLRPVLDRYQLVAATLDPGAALEMIREELADPLSDRIIEILLVALEQGSSVIIDILLDLAASTSADLRLAADLETAQLETRVESWVAALLPFAVLGLLVSRSPEYRAFYATRAGTTVVLLGAGLIAVGLHLIARLGRPVDEERVLARGSER